MATSIKMPKLGLTMNEGLVSSWRKSEGDTVAKGEILLDVATDKLTFEVECPEDGVLLKIIVPEGQSVPVGELLGVIGFPGEDISSVPVNDRKTAKVHEDIETGPSSATTGPVAAEKPRAFVKASPRAKKTARDNGLDISEVRGTGPDGRIIQKDVLAFLEGSKHRIPKSSPLASIMAKELGVDLSAVSVKGRIMKGDVLAAAETAVGTEPQAMKEKICKASVGGETGKDRNIPLTQMRKVIGERMFRSSATIPSVTYNIEVDFTELVLFRDRIKDKMKAEGTRISFNDILMKMCAVVLEEQPMCNATIDGDHFILHGDVNIGLAVAVEGGLVVPNVKVVQSKTLREIAVETDSLVEAARTNGLTMDDITGGTFTITNLGMFGIHSFNPIINPPEACILAVNAIVKRPVVVDDEIVTRSICMLCLTADHRIVDGADASRFLARLKEIIENPYLMFI